MPGAPAPAPALTPARIAEIAHELRAPLGGIDAMVELLEATPLDGAQKPLVAALRASLAHLRAIADAVLADETSGNEASGDEASGPTRRMSDFLTEFETACRARASAKGLEFGLAVEADRGPLAVIEPGPLRQVLENLVDNAIRLTPAGRITLAITAPEAGRLTFCLTDEGPGITEDEARRLIREGGAIAGRPGGAGIGLSIAGRIVARHGGQLIGGPVPEGKAATNKGARFSFDWPVTNAQRRTREADLQQTRLQEPSLRKTHLRETCLIVDDHPASRLVMRTILAAAGYACLEAASIEEALVRVQESHPAFVLTDLNMPGGGGARLIEHIAALAAEARPRLVVVSAEAVDAGHPLRARIDGAIQKPITVRGLLETLAGLAPAVAVRAA